MDLGWIREGLKKPGKTQRGLAAALGVDPAAVNRLLAGNRQLKAAEIEKAAVYLEMRLQGHQIKGGITPPRALQAQETQELLEVKGMAEGGEDGWAPFNGETVQYITRPDNLLGVPNAYAVFVRGESMVPRYYPGEIVHIHPGRPVQQGSYVLVQKRPAQEGDTPLAVVKRLVRRSAGKITLEQYNPPKTISVPADQVLSMHRVVGSSEA